MLTNLCPPKALEMGTALVRERLPVAPAGDAVELSQEASEDEAGEIAQGSMPDLLADLAERAKADVGAAFEPAVLRQFADRRARDCAAFMRLRGELNGRQFGEQLLVLLLQGLALGCV